MAAEAVENRVLPLLASALRATRLETHVTQPTIAAALGVDQGVISRLESGDQRPYVDQVLAFDRACGKPHGWSLRKAGLIHDPVTAEAAIIHDARIDETARRMLIAFYRTAISESDGDGSARR